MGNNKVTLTIGGYDTDHNDTISFEQPTVIAGSIDKVDDLTAFNLNTPTIQKLMTNKLPFVVYVKNVNSTQGSLDYRGSYYLYDYSTGGYQQVVMGNHSHANMEILDQLGNIQSGSLAAGEKKALIIQKIQGSDEKYSYKLSLEDNDRIPDLPADTANKELYLASDSDGKLKWANTFAPAQSFKILRITVSTSNRLTDKKLQISTDIMTANSAVYKPDLGDEMMVFDNGVLVQCVVTQTTTGYEVEMVSEEDNHTFDIGETITILIIKNGVQGILDTVNAQFATKADLARVISGGTIDLSSYLTKDEASLAYSGVNHTHSDYLRKDEYDVFDYRYADYQHAHSQYMTRADVLSILIEVAGASTEDTQVSTILDMLKSDVENKISAIDANYVTRTQMETFFKSRMSSINSDSVTVTIDGTTLTEYLSTLKQSIIIASSKQANDIRLSETVVNIGDGNKIGGYSNGDTIASGTTLSQFLSKLMTNEIVPELVDPVMNITVKQDLNECGKYSQFVIDSDYAQNNGGSISSAKIEIYKTEDMSDSPEVIDYIIGTQYTFSRLLDADETGFCFLIKISANVSQGAPVYSNTNTAYRLAAKTLEYTYKACAERKLYIGYTDSTYADSVITATTLSGILSQLYVVDDSNANSFKLNFGKSINGRTIFVLIPKNKKLNLKEVVHEQQACDVLDLFKTKDDITFTDAYGSSALSNEYKVYYLVLNKITSGIMTLDFRCEEAE